MTTSTTYKAIAPDGTEIIALKRGVSTKNEYTHMVVWFHEGKGWIDSGVRSSLKKAEATVRKDYSWCDSDKVAIVPVVKI